MSYTFRRGEAYFATPCLDGAKRRFVVCLGRSEIGVSFAFADDLTIGRPQLSSLADGREFVQLDSNDGLRYNVSSTVPVPAEQAAEVLSCIRNANI